VTWLVDTNAASEFWRRARCHPSVATWWIRVEGRDLFQGTSTLGEARRGIEDIPHRDPTRVVALNRRLRDVSDILETQIPDMDPSVADEPGRMSVAGAVLEIIALLAAEPRVHDLVLGMRNTPSVSWLEVRTFNSFGNAQA